MMIYQGTVFLIISTASLEKMNIMEIAKASIALRPLWDPNGAFKVKMAYTAVNTNKITKMSEKCPSSDMSSNDAILC